MSGVALIVDEKGAALKIGTNKTLVLTHENGGTERVGINALGSVILFGNVEISTHVVHILNDYGIPLVLLSGKSTGESLNTHHIPEHHALLRHNQHLAFASESQRLSLAKKVILAKFESIAINTRNKVQDEYQNIYRAMHSVSRACCLSSLMGIEGAHSAKHFKYLSELYQKQGVYSFNGRTRQPPLDPPNAVMSLCYTLLLEDAKQLLIHAGLDIQLGFLHGPLKNRASLALDLIEPARAEIDHWVLSILTRKILKPGMFSCKKDSKGCRLNKEGRTILYRVWFKEGRNISQAPMCTLLATIRDELRQLPESVEDIHHH